MKSIDELSINTIRTLSIDAIQKANSGHPGLPMGAAPMAYVLWAKHLKHTAKDSAWLDRDRFILSAGHGSMLIYSLLNLFGYIKLDDIKDFRQWESLTPGHPEFKHTPGVEATTGPLGQGTANAVGMAFAERHLAGRFNTDEFTLFDHFTYALVSDGDLMEGIAAEAAAFAGHLKLGKLIYLYDANDISLDGPSSLCFSTEDVGKRYESYGWQVITVKDGDTDLDAIDAAITSAKAETEKPSIIIVKTTIGYGSPNKAGTASCHGSPLGEDEIKLTKEKLGWDTDKSFYIPDEVKAHCETICADSTAKYEAWTNLLEQYKTKNPELAIALNEANTLALPEGWDKDLPEWKPGEKLATRVASGKALNAIADNVPWLLGGDADLSCSTKTHLDNEESFNAKTGLGRNIHFGVRENAMGSIANGISYHGGAKPYVSTFFMFSDYLRPAFRLAAMNNLPVVYVFTHDSVAVGEDGPTHQPIEQLMSLRTIPNLCVLRPSDPNETVEAWKFAAANSDTPVVLVLSRQKLEAIDREKYAKASMLQKGAYVISDGEDGKFDAILIATGSEVGLAMDAQAKMAEKGTQVRVVAMPSWDLFEAQSDEYKESVLPKNCMKRVSIEAGVTLGWQKYVGCEGKTVGIDKFGSSAPGNIVLEKYGMTVENVIKNVEEIL